MSEEQKEQFERKPLEWKLVDTIEDGDVRAEITIATLHNGRRAYSTAFRRIVKDRDGVDTGKTTGFFKFASDFDSIISLCDQVQIWIEADKEEQRQHHNDHNKRNGRKGTHHKGRKNHRREARDE